MISLGLAAAGIAGLVLAALALRAIGPAYRVARLLAATREVSLGEAAAMAADGGQRYVRIVGRVSSDEEFPDEQDRPLVYRHTRIEISDGRGGWRTVSDEREAVPFGIESRSDFVAVDALALDLGLVVLPRESVGLATDLPAGLANGLDPRSTARLVIRQISAVEHATVAGMPVIDPDGAPTMTAGLGRPLILSTLEAPAAMRVLAYGKRGLVLAATGLLIASLGLFAAALVAWLGGV